MDRLLHDGHRVTVLDLFTDGKAEYLKGKKNTENLRLICADVSEKDSLQRRYFQNVDWVFHLAGKNPTGSGTDELIKYHKSNVNGTLHVLENARREGVSRFICVGSSTCYGIPDSYPTPETAPIRPESSYALTKYLGESYALHWGKVYNLSVVILRPFNVYGPKMRKNGTYGPFFTPFINQKLQGLPYTVVGDGEQSRDLVHVADVVEAFILAARSRISQEVFNVGSGKTYSINMIVKLLGGKVTYVPKRPYEVRCTHADITKIRNMLGWEPKIPIIAGVKQMLQSMTYWKRYQHG